MKAGQHVWCRISEYMSCGHPSSVRRYSCLPNKVLVTNFHSEGGIRAVLLDHFPSNKSNIHMDLKRSCQVRTAATFRCKLPISPQLLYIQWLLPFIAPLLSVFSYKIETCSPFLMYLTSKLGFTGDDPTALATLDDFNRSLGQIFEGKAMTARWLRAAICKPYSADYASS